MLAQQAVWQTGTGTALTADVGEFRLVVRRDDHRCQHIRFLVVRHAAEGNCVVSLGTKADMAAAMRAAIEIANRLSAP